MHFRGAPGLCHVRQITLHEGSKMNLPLRGTSFARLAIARAANPKASRLELAKFCEARWGRDGDAIAKAVVVGGTTVGPLTGSIAEPVSTAFLESVSEQSVAGRLPLRQVPLNVRLVWNTAGTVPSTSMHGLPNGTPCAVGRPLERLWGRRGIIRGNPVGRRNKRSCGRFTNRSRGPRGICRLLLASQRR